MNYSYTIEQIDSMFLLIICVHNILNGRYFLDEFRSLFPGVVIQGITPKIIFGKEHAKEVLKIVYELRNRNITIAKKIEMDILMRFSLTNQIVEAIRIGGLKENNPGCLIIISKEKNHISKILEYLRNEFQNFDSSLLSPNKEKMSYLYSLIGNKKKNYQMKQFKKILIEKSTLVGL